MCVLAYTAPPGSRHLLFEKEFLHNNYIDEFDILKFNEFSDHAAVYFTMGKINTTNNPVI